VGGRACEGISLLYSVTSGNLVNFMGDLRDWWPEPNQTAIGAEFLQRAEEATQGVIAQVQPTVVSENRRKAVIDYVQRLIRTRLGCEVSNLYTHIPTCTYTHIYICVYV